MKTYIGDFTVDTKDAIVLVRFEEGPNTFLLPRVPLEPMAVFEWGYEGEDPASLALALLADVLGERPAPHSIWRRGKAWQLHQAFLKDYVGKWHGRRPFSVTEEEVLAWVRQQEAKQPHTSGADGSESARQRPSAPSIKSPAGGTGKSTAVEAEGGAREAG